MSDARGIAEFGRPTLSRGHGTLRMALMRAVVQRVSHAQVTVEGNLVSSIDAGLLVYLGIERDEAPDSVSLLADKIRYLRVFEDSDGKLNRDVVEAGGVILVVSAFTVCADARQGRRPSFSTAAPADAARPIYESFCRKLSELGVAVRQGVFQGYMQVQAVNDGPICILLDTQKRF